MTYEEAVYYKLLLLCGYNDELQKYIDTALEVEDPLSDIVLALSTTGGDDKTALSLLNEYILQVSDSDIDYDNAVFESVMSFLKRRYINDSMSMKEITELMYQLALHSERYHNCEPWWTMYLMEELFEEAESGYISKEDFQHRFEEFIINRVLFSSYPPFQPKESLFKKLFSRIRRRK